MLFVLPLAVVVGIEVVAFGGISFQDVNVVKIVMLKILFFCSDSGRIEVEDIFMTRKRKQSGRTISISNQVQVPRLMIDARRMMMYTADVTILKSQEIILNK